MPGNLRVWDSDATDFDAMHLAAWRVINQIPELFQLPHDKHEFLAEELVLAASFRRVGMCPGVPGMRGTPVMNKWLLQDIVALLKNLGLPSGRGNHGYGKYGTNGLPHRVARALEEAIAAEVRETSLRRSEGQYEQARDAYDTAKRERDFTPPQVSALTRTEMEEGRRAIGGQTPVGLAKARLRKVNTALDRLRRTNYEGSEKLAAEAAKITGHDVGAPDFHLPKDLFGIGRWQGKKLDKSSGGTK